MNKANEVITDSGLLVPASAVQRKRKVLPKEKAKLIRRMFIEMPAEKLTALFACTECNTPVSFGTVNKILTRVPGGELVLRCKCSDRVVGK
jgi:hypothetical protein